MSYRGDGHIQPESLRAPEVLIGAEWDTKVDIWNLGCLVRTHQSCIFLI
jgi:serine/threonine-protein kinase SRPK3